MQNVHWNETRWNGRCHQAVSSVTHPPLPDWQRKLMELGLHHCLWQTHEITMIKSKKARGGLQRLPQRLDALFPADNVGNKQEGKSIFYVSKIFYMVSKRRFSQVSLRKKVPRHVLFTSGSSLVENLSYVPAQVGWKRSLWHMQLLCRVFLVLLRPCGS